MNHLTIEQLVELREPGQEPGLAEAARHLETCETCRAEADRLAQRVARLRALPPPRPGRSRFLEVRARYVRERRGRRWKWAGLGGLALAASVTLVAVTRPPAAGPDPSSLAAEAELVEMMARSQALEEALHAWDPDSRMLDGRTASIAARIEEQLSAVDRQLEVAKLLERRSAVARNEQLRLWRERVGLLDALVDVHVTRATYAGM
jgi:hypothetical protein